MSFPIFRSNVLGKKSEEKNKNKIALAARRHCKVWDTILFKIYKKLLKQTLKRIIAHI